MTPELANPLRNVKVEMCVTENLSLGGSGWFLRKQNSVLLRPSQPCSPGGVGG